MKFSDRLRELRAENSLTQKQLADAIQTTEAFISALETGRKLPSYPTALRLAQVLACTNPQDLWKIVEKEKIEGAVGKIQRKPAAYEREMGGHQPKIPDEVLSLATELAKDPEIFSAISSLCRSLANSDQRNIVLHLIKALIKE